MAKAFVCYAKRKDAGFVRSIYRTEVSATPITNSDDTTVQSIDNFKTYLASVLNANTLVPVTTLATASLNAINAAIDTLTNGVIAGKKSSVKVSILPGVGNEHVVRLEVTKNGEKVRTEVPLVSQPAPAPSPSPSPAPSPSGG